ncbi:MAG: DUF4364 family protein [Oscillospiraceae bacterium]|nr:DUF4364 family protein [Oscillospiraceae bacterium]
MNDYNTAELNSAHLVKVLICYLLERLKQPVTEGQLYEIAVESGVVNYFYYTEALEGLLENRSLTRTERNGEIFIVPTEKGRFGADYFNDTVPLYFRKEILKAALYYFARLERESSADISITETDNGCEVNCTVGDANYDLMRVSLYAPDSEQAELIKEKIMLDPAEFYRRVLGYALENKEEHIEVDMD